MNAIFTAWATPDEFYQEQLARLVSSMEEFGLRHYAETRGPFGSWAECCFHKPHFIMDMLDRFPDQDIVYIDADAEVKSYPVLLDDITTDIAFVDNGNGNAIASMVYFANNRKVRDFILEWVETNARYSHNRAVDQENFDFVAKTFETLGKISITKLPAEYCFEDGITKSKVEPVIVQWIASRIGRLLQ